MKVLLHFCKKGFYACAFIFGVVRLGYSQCPVIPSPVTYQTTEGNFSIGSSLGINPDFLPDSVKLARAAGRAARDGTAFMNMLVGPTLDIFQEMKKCWN